MAKRSTMRQWLSVGTLLVLGAAMAGVVPSHTAASTSCPAVLLQGKSNTVDNTKDCPTVGGGDENVSTGNDSTVGGGAGNTATYNGATVAGGGYNSANGPNTTIGGGGNNEASDIE